MIMKNLTLAALALAIFTPSVALSSQGRLIQCATLYAIDGDTISCDGINMRDMGDGAPFVSGYDTPEIRDSKCAKELELGRAAKTRMNELLETLGMQIYDSGRVDKTRSKRPLVWVKLASGVTAGHVLMNEGMARRWTPSYEADWCSN